MTVEQLFRAYEANEARAQKQYGDRALKITGRVAAVELNISNKATIALVSPNQFMPVTLDNSEDIDQKATALNKGDKIVAVCVGGREILGRPFLNDCIIQ